MSADQGTRSDLFYRLGQALDDGRVSEADVERPISRGRPRGMRARPTAASVLYVLGAVVVFAGLGIAYGTVFADLPWTLQITTPLLFPAVALGTCIVWRDDVRLRGRWMWLDWSGTWRCASARGGRGGLGLGQYRPRGGHVHRYRCRPGDGGRGQPVCGGSQLQTRRGGSPTHPRSARRLRCVGFELGDDGWRVLGAAR